MPKRTLPNIIITGTPGTGKTTHAEQLATATGLRHISVNQVAKDRDCYDGYDDEVGSWVVDEDKLLDALENEAQAGGLIIDWHACDLFPRRWIDLVVVLRCDPTRLYDRLAARGYAGKKLDDNMDCEIMEVLVEEARQAFDDECVVQLTSDEADQVDANVERMEAWVRQWKTDHEDGVEMGGPVDEEDEEEDDE
ncbi:AAA domain-containing protein [Phyllosticta citribraziliensis]|uniref:Adenylate kinase isoenzyme 6 homolog n=1 Tax=Phyllosticta citribraziliensis TaxID=989973 RepID=A0ABR1L882_9PEZI